MSAVVRWSFLKVRKTGRFMASVYLAHILIFWNVHNSSFPQLKLFSPKVFSLVISSLPLFLIYAHNEHLLVA